MEREADETEELKPNAALGQEPEGDKEEEEAPKDIRGAIKAAYKEVEEKADADDDEGDKDADKGKVQARSRADTNRDKSRSKKVDADESGEGEKDADGSKEPDKSQPDKVEPPPFYKNKGKVTWDKLSPEDKQVIIAREKEVSDGFAQNSARFKNLEDVEKVIAPRLQVIQRFGVTPAQTVDRLFQWMEALSNPDANVRANSFKQLASSFGVNVAQLSQSASGGKADSDPVDETNEPPAWATQVVNKVSTLESQIATQQQQAAEGAIASWANAKNTDGSLIRPHYSKVNQLMYQLMVSNAVPMKDGNLDLDGAYAAACKISPEVATLIQQETAAKEEKERAEKATKDAQLAKARLAKAKAAGAGLKPAAPSMPMSQVSKKANGQSKPTSVRDSIRAALEEARE